MLCGCGGTNTNGTNDNTENQSSNNNSVEKKEYTLNEYISNKETVWYLTDGYGKDDEIGQIFVIEPDGTLYYASCDWTLGEVEQKEDAEIIATVKSQYKESQTTRINNIIALEGEEGYYGERRGKIVTDLSTIYTPYLNDIKPAPYKLSLKSDSTGNKAENQIIVIKEVAPLSGRESDYMPYTNAIWNLTLSYLVPYESDKGTTNCFSIYDSWFGGYKIDSYREGYNYEYFLTRLDSTVVFKLDEIGTENIGVDDANTLFDDERIKVEIKYEYFD